MSIDSSWTSYERRSPTRSILCEFARIQETSQSRLPQITQRWIGTSEELSPEFNVAGLYWRLTGIGRERLEAMSAQWQQQANLMGRYEPWRGLLGDL